MGAGSARSLGAYLSNPGAAPELYIHIFFTLKVCLLLVHIFVHRIMITISFMKVSIFITVGVMKIYILHLCTQGKAYDFCRIHIT